MKLTSALFALTMVLGPVAAFAQEGHTHGMHVMNAPPDGAISESSKAFDAASARMHKDMAIEFSGDADADFARAMIPHHQGAIDMAKIVLQYGKDPEIRKLAEAIVTALEAEIAFMKAWLAKREK